MFERKGHEGPGTGMPNVRQAKKPRFPIEEEKLVKSFKTERDAAYGDEIYTDWQNNYEKYDRCYRMEFKNKNNLQKWQSQVYLSLGFTAVETVAGFLADTFLSRDPFFTIMPGGRGDVAKAYNTEVLMRAYFRRNRFRLKAMDIIQDVCKYGYCVTRQFWRVQMKPRKATQFPGISEPDQYLWDDPWFRVYSGLDFVKDPYEKYLEDSRWCSLDEEIDFFNLARSGMFFNLDKVWERVKRGGHPIGIPSQTYGEKREQRTTTADENSRTLKLTTRSGTINVSDARLPDPEQKFLAYYVDDEILVGFQPMPYDHIEHPFSEYGLVSQKGSIRGVGVLEPVYPTNTAMTTMLNQRLDGVHYTLNPRVVVNKQALIKKDALSKNYPGQEIEIESFIDADKIVYQLPINDKALASFRDTFAVLRQHGEETTAVNPQATGSYSSKVRSATETSLAAAGATARFTKYARWLSECGFNPLLKQLVGLAVQFTTQDKFYYLTDIKKQFNITPDSIAPDVDIEVKDLTFSNKDVQSQLFINLLAAVAPWIQQIQGLNVRPLLEGFLRNIPMIQNPDEILPPPGNEMESMVQNDPQGAMAMLGPKVAQTPNIPGAPPGQSQTTPVPSQAMGRRMA